MAVANKTVVIDGQTYKEGDTIHELGSLQCVEVRGEQRDYQGFIQDKDKLPKYEDLATGSSALLIDPDGVESTIIGKYDAPTKQWLNLKGGVIV
jgi:hypothetical protein